MEYVFVYGTLRKGFFNHHFLLSTDKDYFVDYAKTKDRYAMFATSYIPFVSKNIHKSYIFGEVYLVDERMLASLDRLEGHPNWYKREKVPVVLKSGKEVEAWIYFNNEQTDHLIESGDFTDYAGKNYPNFEAKLKKKKV